MLVRFCLAFLALAVVGGSPASAQPGTADEATIVVFSRHTFRGIDHSLGQKKLSFGQSNLELTVPMLSYGMEATPHGLVFAQRYASPALNQAATTAVAGLGAKPFSGQWDEIRVDLATSRTFFTGLYIREGLQAGQKTPILLTGCPTTEGKGTDAVSIGSPVKNCIRGAELRPFQTSSGNLERLRQAGESLLNEVGAAVGKPGPYQLPSGLDPVSGALPQVYYQLGHLASGIEMSAEQGSPLELLFPGAPKEGARQHGFDAVRRASNYLGVRFTALIPLEMANAITVFPLQYINSTPAGHHVIVLSHDDDLSSICRSLDLIGDAGNVDDLAFFPLESIVFALTDKRACVVRMRIQKGPDGSMTGPFESKVMWRGSRAEWEEKVQKVFRQAQAWPVGAAERAKVQVLPAPTLDVMCPR